VEVNGLCPAVILNMMMIFYLQQSRRLKEETGIEVEIQSIVNVDSAFLTPDCHFLTIYLLASVIGGELCAGDDFGEAAWFPMDGPLPNMSFRQDAELIRTYAQGELLGVPVCTEE
jgi:ADP-ribose pyrophosphatase YjhB (NUDIX family)